MSTTFQIPDQTGRTAIITGANIGLGFEMSKALSARGARVIMACRSPERGERARQQILSDNPSAAVSLEQLDVSSLQSVRDFASRVGEELTQLDLLINNAGIMAVPQQCSIDGHEMQFATNHLGHFLLTGLLLPRLQAATGSRVVAISSIAARDGQIALDDLMCEQNYDQWKAYNQSKLANLMFALELQRRLTANGSSMLAVSAHPGAAATNLFATPGGSLVKRVLTPLMKPFLFHSAEAGAMPVLYAATAADVQPGGYYGPKDMNEMKGPPAPARIPDQAHDETVANALWQASERLTGISYP